jgi:hypothetical protein
MLIERHRAVSTANAVESVSAGTEDCATRSG